MQEGGGPAGGMFQRAGRTPVVAPRTTLSLPCLHPRFWGRTFSIYLASTMEASHTVVPRLEEFGSWASWKSRLRVPQEPPPPVSGCQRMRVMQCAEVREQLRTPSPKQLLLHHRAEVRVPTLEHGFTVAAAAADC